MTPMDALGMNATGIGSLPHHNIDAALTYSFQLPIPFLPQIPIRNPWEFMVAQAIEGLPGLRVEADGLVTLDLDVWTGRTHALTLRLEKAFANTQDPEAFEAFEPSCATSSGWQPFLWEAGERQLKLAKIQLAGPLTCQWVLKLTDGSTLDSQPEISSQIFHLVLARGIAMSRRLQANGTQPLLYLDEPGLYALSMKNPRHAVAFRELQFMIQTLKKENVWIGLHCCSNADWDTILRLEPHVLSIDADLSLDHLLTHQELLRRFINQGGRLSLGIIPTLPQSADAHSAKPFDCKERLQRLHDTLIAHFPNDPKLPGKILREALYTPACGLALHTTSAAESVLDSLMEFRHLTERKFQQS